MVKIHEKSGTLEGVVKHYFVKYSDNRGWFSQAWTTGELEAMGFRKGFVQHNIASSRQGVLRGMHRQDQTKLVHVVKGRIFDVALDPETGEWEGYTLEEGECLYIPPQFAHGYFVLSDDAVVQYFVDSPYDISKEENFKWDAYGIEWPLTIRPVLSTKDAHITIMD